MMGRLVIRYRDGWCIIMPCTKELFEDKLALQYVLDNAREMSFEHHPTYWTDWVWTQ